MPETISILWKCITWLGSSANQSETGLAILRWQTFVSVVSHRLGKAVLLILDKLSYTSEAMTGITGANCPCCTKSLIFQKVSSGLFSWQSLSSKESEILQNLLMLRFRNTTPTCLLCSIGHRKSPGHLRFRP